MVIWEQYGLRGNPFDILPLLEGGDLNIKNAFVGREKEREHIDNVFSSENRACITICGNVGVGKTSIANFEKFIWKYENKEKPLFSFRREIEANKYILNKNSFLLEIIGSIIREIELLESNLLQNDSFLRKLNQLVDITQTFGITGNISAGVPGVINFGADFSEKQPISPVQITTASLEKHFFQLLEYIMSHKIAGHKYKGLIIHVNNFDVVISENKKQVIRFFAEIRDLLQTKNSYFIFLGPTKFFKDIVSMEQRVRSIFDQRPLILNPLSKSEFLDALNNRMSLLQSDTANKIIKPFEDNVIYELHDMFDGDIRMILTSLKAILDEFSTKLPKTLTLEEAMVLLGREQLSRIEDILTDEVKKVLFHIVQSSKYLTVSEIASALNKEQSNISNYYFTPLIERRVIEVKSSSGRFKYWGLTKDYLPLKQLTDSQEKLNKKISMHKQLSIFE